MRLAGKVALITGAGAGLGREAALLFAQEGARVIVTDVSAGRAQEVAKQVNERAGEAFAVAADVSVESDVAAAVQVAVDRHGKLDVMFANAGVAVDSLGAIPFEQLPAQSWQRLVDVNLTGVFFSCKHAAAVMKRNGGGTIVVTSSAASLAAYPGWAAYAATKGGVNALVRGMALDLGRYGIRVNALCPASGMSPNFVSPLDAPVVPASYEESAGAWDPWTTTMPLKLNRPPSLADNAKVALFLASDDSAYMSGVCVPSCDGGMLARVPMLMDLPQPTGTVPAASAPMEGSADEGSAVRVSRAVDGG